jgi:type VI secretion system protein VasG
MAELAEAIRPELLEVFKPALLGRMNIVPYYPLADDVMREIVRLQLGRIAQRVRDTHRAAFTYDDAVVTAIRNRCREVESGARNVDHILTDTLLPEISREFLSHMTDGRSISRIHITVGDEGTFRYDIG